MIDETTRELLSRALDDDLEPEARSAFEARLAAEPELRDRLERLRELRGAVARLAESEQPPHTLDALVEPLRRGRPPRRAVRPAFAWLAAAASVVLAATLGLELARTNPSPAPAPPVGEQKVGRAAPAATPGARGVFRLSPLPQPRDPESVPQGAAERLLREGPAEPRIEPPEPLEVVGPLDAPPPASRDGRSQELSEELARTSTASHGAEPAEGGKGRRERARDEAGSASSPSAAESEQMAAPAAGGRAMSTVADRTESVRAPGPVPDTRRPVVLEVETGGSWFRVTVPDGGLPGGDGLPLALIVRGSRIVTVSARGDGPPPPDGLVTALLALDAVGLPDGSHAAVARLVARR